MNKLEEKARVYFARTIRETNSIERSLEKKTVKSLLLRTFIRVWLIGANALLWLFGRLFFKSGIPPEGGFRDITVYTVGTLGDNVLMLPAIAAIKSSYPGATLTAITNCDGFSDIPAKDILGRSPHIDRHITLPSHPVRRQGFRIAVNFPEAEEYECDLFVNLSPFGNRGWIGAVVREMIFARRLRSKWAIGFKMSTYSRKNIFNTVQHRFMKNEARRTRGILSMLGIAQVENKDLLARDPDAENRVKRLVSVAIEELRPIIVINPGAKLSVSRWPYERFGALSIYLKEKYNAHIVINGTLSEKELCNKVVKASNNVASSLSGELSIQELIELLRISSACITNNTGPMTLSAMVGIPTIIISSTRFSPSFYMPIGEKLVNVFSFGKSSYSYNDEGDMSDDLKQISVNDVLKAISEVLAPDSNRIEDNYL